MGFCRICKIEYGADKSLKFHRLPKDEITKNKWIEIIGKVVPPSSLVCSKHFVEEDYIFNLNGQKKKLKSNAFPKLNLSAFMDSNSKNLVLSGVQHGCTIVLTVQTTSNEDTKHFHEETNNLFTTNNNVTSRANNGMVRSMSDSSIESDLTHTSYKTVDQSEQTGLQAPVTLCTPKYPGDLRPEHFVQTKDFFMLKRYLHQQRMASKRIQKKMSRWQQQVNNVRKLLFNLKEEGLVSSKIMDKIQASLPNINQNGI